MTIAVALLTYSPAAQNPRTLYAKKTLEALLANLRYDGLLRFHIADDGSYDGHREMLIAMCDGHEVSVTNAERRGYGASFNLATQALHSDCTHLLMVEDDWELTRELRLDPLVAALDCSDGALGCIRLGYIGWTQELRGRVAAFAGQTFLMLDPASPEPHVWAGHPRLETREYQRRVSEWPEGIDPGSTEFWVSQRPPAREGVAWPLDLGIRAGQIHGTIFEHIGTVQAREDQR